MANALQFQGKFATKGTEEFVRKFDKFFDCLNGQFENQGTYTRKEALKPYRDIHDPRFKVFILTYSFVKSVSKNFDSFSEVS